MGLPGDEGTDVLGGKDDITARILCRGQNFPSMATSSRLFAWVKAASFPDPAAWNARPQGRPAIRPAKGALLNQFSSFITIRYVQFKIS